MKSVLKATSAHSSPAQRIVLRAPSEVDVVPAAEPGVWISHVELEALKARCFSQGRAEGEEGGRQLAQQSARQQADKDAKARLEQELKERQHRYTKEQAEKWRGLAAALASQFQALREHLQNEVTEWTFVAVTRLLGQQTPEHVVLAVRQVLADARLDEPLKVLLHAQDLASLEACGATEQDLWPENIQFAADARVGVGGCLIQSDSQALDARLEVQLALLREALDNARRERAAMQG